MKKVLIVDDQEFKLDDIKNIFDSTKVYCDLCSDFFEGQEMAVNNDYDLIILDMSILEEYTRNEFAGLNILQNMDLYGIETPVVLFTQFFNFSNLNDLRESYDKNGYYRINEFYKKDHIYDYDSQRDIHLLPNMHDYLSQHYLNYLGCVLYVQNSFLWIENLKTILKYLGGNFDDCIIVG